jgi:CRP/FNR family transcriptional regulator, cyclic AMP receptor protein
MRRAMYFMGILDDLDIEWIAANGTGIIAPAGKVLVREGQPLDSIFILLDGRLSVVIGGNPVAVLQAGEIVGEISYVDGQLPVATVSALEESKLIQVRKDLLQKKTATDKKFAANLYHAIALFLSDRLRATTARLAQGGRTPEVPDDDMDDDMMDTVSVGARRFDALLRRVSR